jgi:hypothetical protein
MPDLASSFLTLDFSNGKSLSAATRSLKFLFLQDNTQPMPRGIIRQNGPSFHHGDPARTVAYQLCNIALRKVQVFAPIPQFRAEVSGYNFFLSCNYPAHAFSPVEVFNNVG